MWANLEFASPAITEVVKTETPDALLNELNEHKKFGNVLEVRDSPDAPIDSDPNEGTSLVELEPMAVDGKHSLISCFARIKPSPGWFVGLSSEDMCVDDERNQSRFNRTRKINLRGWNSGIYKDQDYIVESKTENEKPYKIQLLLVFAETYGDVNLTTSDIPLRTNAAGGDSSCFPAGELVTMHDGRTIPVEQLQIGDIVHGGEVFMFSHRDKDAMTAMTVLEYRESNMTRNLRASPGHMVYIMGGKQADGRELVRAGDVSAGDMLVGADGTGRMVVGVGQTFAKGLYNPHTLSGDVVVGGVVVSCYTESVRKEVAAAMLMPVRGLHRIGVWSGRGVGWVLGGPWNCWLGRLFSWAR